MSTFAQSVDRTIGAITSRLFLAITLLELAIVIFAAITIYQDRTIFEERAIVYSENLVQVLSRDLNSSFARIDLMLLVIRDEAERLQSVGGIGASDIRAFADRQMDRQSDASGIVVTDMFGAVIYRYGSSNQPEPNYADRDYFSKLKSGRGLELVISKPLLGKRSGVWQIVFARRVNSPDGTFAGVVYATVPLELFQKQFSALKLGPKSAINLRDADLATVTRYPDTIPTSTGNPTVSKEWREKLKENPEFGSYFAVGLDNLGRAISFRKIGQFSHYIIVGLYPPDFLEPWTSQAKHTIVFATVAMMLVALLGVGARKLANAWFELRSAEKDIKRMNADLDRKVGERTAQLEAANKELDAFAYSASHDLRAPLQTINGFSQALLEDYGAKLEAEARDYLERIRAASQRMAQLVDDLLRLSRITRADMTHEPVDLSALARSVAKELVARDPARNVDVDIAAGEIVQGDRRLLRVLLENLFANAWKFTSKLAHARIEFSAAENSGEHVYCVRDDGAGFDMAYAGKLFTPFQRLHAATEFPGNGVGLATVQRIVQRHGGRVWAEGTPGKGATFYFTIAGAPVGAQEPT